MKQKKNQRTADAFPPGAPAGKIPARHKWPFRLAALALPFLLLGLLEAVLRLAHYGHSTDFFLKSRAGGRDVLIDNDKFGWSFFPQAMARTPRPFSIPATKPPNTYRIFVLGESAAWGDPEPAAGFARMIEVMLRERYPGTSFEVVNAAMTAISSHAILRIARDCARQNGDLWLIYMGHNEVIGPLGAGAGFGTEAPSLPLIRATLAMKSARVAQLLESVRDHFSGAQTQSWGGMTMFLGKQVVADDRSLERVYRHFDRNLRDILRAGERAGVKQIVCTVGSNLKDCAPFASKHRSGLGGTGQTEWEKRYASGVMAEAASRFTEATNNYYQAAQIDSHFAELSFRFGRCLSALGDHVNARRSFEQARDLDTLRFRADSRINGLVRQNVQGRTNEGIYFFDASEALAVNSSHGISGDEFFYEHVHLTFEGNYLIARGVAEQIAQLLPQTIASRAVHAAWISAEECARRLAWIDWNRYRVIEDIHQRLLDPPFTNQLGHLERDARLQKQLATLSSAIRPEGLRRAADQYRDALVFAPDDWMLHDKFAEVLRELRDRRGAMEQGEWVLRLLPHYPGAYNNLGNLFLALGQSAEAEKYFSEALRRKPAMVEALTGMGRALAGEKKFSQAIGYYTRALRIRPDFVAAHVNLGLVLAGQGNTVEAMSHYETALRLRPGNGMAHANLGKLLAGQGDLASAARHFSNAVRWMPDNAAAHFNLGNALAAQNQELAAAGEYAAAVNLEPNFADARVNLGTILARSGQLPEAAVHLAEALRLNPNSVQAHLGLGAILEQQGKWSEAAGHYREALRINPANASAKKYLDRVMAQGDGSVP